MAAEPNSAHLFITERHLDEPPNERLVSQNDRQLHAKRRDKQDKSLNCALCMTLRDIDALLLKPCFDTVGLGEYRFERARPTESLSTVDQLC